MERNDKYFIDSAEVSPCLLLRKWNGSVWNGLHTSSVNEKRFQMVPEVIKLEDESVLNHRNPVFVGI